MKILKKRNNYNFLIMLILLILSGLLILTTASSDLGVKKFNDPYFYLKHQIFNGILPGIFLFLLIYFFIPLNFFKKYSFYILLLNIFLLILVFTPLGLRIKGAERWLNLGFFSFQPSEFLKISYLFYLSALLANRQSKKNNFFKIYLPVLSLLFLIGFLIYKQPATSIFIIILASASVIILISQIKIKYLILSILILSFFTILVIKSSPYRYQRILGFFKPDLDPYGVNYHINQTKISIGSGGLFGVGFGKSTAKINYLPEPIGDSIFAVIAEEFGFIGSIFILFLFLFFILKIFNIGQNSNDLFYKYLCFGFGTTIGIQTFIHIASNSGLIPPTGQPLPFISYGGSSFIVFMIISSIIFKIAQKKY